jgi:hypothetical protein
MIRFQFMWMRWRISSKIEHIGTDLAPFGFDDYLEQRVWTRIFY